MVVSSDYIWFWTKRWSWLEDHLKCRSFHNILFQTQTQRANCLCVVLRSSAKKHFEAKRKCYDTKFDSGKNDLSITWKLLNEVINKRKSRAPLPSSFDFEGKTITDPEEIADKFCKYFTIIGPNLAGAIRDVNSSVGSFIGDVNHPPITLKPIDPCELESICSMFASGKASGYDNISSMRVCDFIWSLHLWPTSSICLYKKASSLIN